MCLTRFSEMIGATAEDECLMCPTNSNSWAGSSVAIAICCDSIIDIISATVLIGLCLTLSLYLSTNKQRKSRVYLLLSKIIHQVFRPVAELNHWTKRVMSTRDQRNCSGPGANQVLRPTLLVGQTVDKVCGLPEMYSFLSFFILLSFRIPRPD